MPIDKAREAHQFEGHLLDTMLVRDRGRPGRARFERAYARLVAIAENAPKDNPRVDYLLSTWFQTFDRFRAKDPSLRVKSGK